MVTRRKLPPLLIASKLDASKPSEAWLYSVPLAAQSALDAWPDRPGAAHLLQALRCARVAQKQVAQGEHRAALRLVMGMVHAVWMAEVVEHGGIVKLGRKSSESHAKAGRKRKLEPAAPDSMPDQDSRDRQRKDNAPKLSEQDRAAIRQLEEQGVPKVRIAEQFHVSRQTIKSVLNRRP